MKSFLYHTIKYICLLILPFALLVRMATFLHNKFYLSAWFSILSAAIVTAVLMFVYFTYFYGKLTGRYGSFDTVKRRIVIALIFVLAYSVYGIFFLSSVKAKSQEVNQELRSLHPILRLGISTLVYVDRDLIITDGARTIEDYNKMKIRENNKSLHIKQKSSDYVHAVDLRTKNRGWLRNKVIQVYFRLMGFRTLRHNGTADHLHVSLKSKDYPNVKLFTQ